MKPLKISFSVSCVCLAWFISISTAGDSVLAAEIPVEPPSAWAEGLASEPVEMPHLGKPHWRWYATGPDKGIQLTRGEFAGRLVVPCNHSDHSDSKRHPYRSHVICNALPMIPLTELRVPCIDGCPL